MWIRQQNKENNEVVNNQKHNGERGKTEETNGKLQKLNNFSAAFVNQKGFSGKATIQKHIKDTLKENLRIPDEKVKIQKQKKDPIMTSLGSPKKTTDVNFTLQNYTKGTLKKHMIEPFPSKRPEIQTTRYKVSIFHPVALSRCFQHLTNIGHSIMDKSWHFFQFQADQHPKTVEFWQPSCKPVGQHV